MLSRKINIFVSFLIPDSFYKDFAENWYDYKGIDALGMMRFQSD